MRDRTWNLTINPTSNPNRFKWQYWRIIIKRHVRTKRLELATRLWKHGARLFRLNWYFDWRENYFRWILLGIEKRDWELKSCCHCGCSERLNWRDQVEWTNSVVESRYSLLVRRDWIKSLDHQLIIE